MASQPIAHPRAHVINPLTPIATTAAATVARHIVERIFRCKAVPGSLQWRSYCELEIKLAIEAAAATVRRAP
jgi:hypothetical protein